MTEEYTVCIIFFLLSLGVNASQNKTQPTKQHRQREAGISKKKKGKYLALATPFYYICMQ